MAEFLQLPDPARCLTLHRQCFVVDRIIAVRHAARQQHIDDLKQLMSNRDNRPLGSPTNNQALVAALELAGGAGGGPGDFAQQREKGPGSGYFCL